jgi:hypothetical protein
MAVRYTGPPNFMQLGSVPAALLNPPITFMCQVEPDAGGFTCAIACINRTAAQGFADDNHYSFETVDNGGGHASMTCGVLGLGLPSSNFASTPAGSLTLGAWNYCVGIIAALNDVRVYCNSRSVSGTNNVAVGIAPIVGDVQIGGRLLGDGSIFRAMHGCLANEGIFTGIASNAQIDAYMGGASIASIAGGALTRIVDLPQTSAATMQTDLGTAGAFTAVPNTAAFSDCVGPSPPAGANKSQIYLLGEARRSFAGWRKASSRRRR